MTSSELFHISISNYLIFIFHKDIFNYRDISCFSFFNNSDSYFLINVYSDFSQSVLKFLKDTKANICNVLIMADNFNIRDSNWDPIFLFHSIHSDLLTNIVDFMDLCLSKSTNQVLTRYSDNVNNSNSTINLMFLRPNLLEFNNHTIHLEYQYLSDHAPLIVDISIFEKHVLTKQCTIIKNSKEEDNFINELIISIKRIDMENLISKDALE